jgi:hypothetical protein
MVILKDIRALTAQFMEDEGFDTNSEAFYDEQINEAQKRLSEITKFFNGHMEMNSVSGKQTYNTPADFIDFHDSLNAFIYINATANTLNPGEADYQNLLNNSDFFTRQDDPSMYWMEEGKFGFYPTPNFTGSKNIQWNYIRYAADMTNDNDPCEFSDKYKYPIAYLACSIIYEKNERFEDKVYYESRAKSRIAEITAATHYVDNARRTSGFSYIGS